MSPLRAGQPSIAASRAPQPGAVVDVPTLLVDLESRFERARLHTGEEDLRLDLAGRALLIRFAGPAMRDALAPSFRHLAKDGAEAEIQIDVWDGKSAGLEPPEIPWTESELDKLGALAYRGADRARAVFDFTYGAITVVDPGRRKALFQTSSAAGVPWYERAAPLRVALNQLLSATGAVLVHAGAVGDGDRAALLVGPGGSGKSTLAVASALEGMNFAGDDYVAVTLDDEPVVHSVHSTAKLSERSLQLLPRLSLPRRDMAADEKYVVQMDAEHPNVMRKRLQLAAIVAPRVTAGSARWKRISGPEGLRALAPSTMLQLPATGATGLSMMASLARTVPSYSLELGSEPGRSVRALREILADAG